jgi:hypothetical protein
MTEKKVHKRHSKDQVKHTHREAFKGHRTKKHFINSVEAEEAEQDILDSQNKNKHGE